MDWGELLILMAGVYFGVGLPVGPLALMVLAPRSDPALAASGWSVRLLLIPGAIAVWPLALRRWARSVPAS